jgi:hypothetical protein
VWRHREHCEESSVPDRQTGAEIEELEALGGYREADALAGTNGMPRFDTGDALDWSTERGGGRDRCLISLHRPLGADDSCVGAEVDEESGSERLDEFDVAVEDRSGTFIARRGKVLGSDPDDDRATSVALQSGASQTHVVCQRDLLATQGERAEVG